MRRPGFMRARKSRPMCPGLRLLLAATAVLSLLPECSGQQGDPVASFSGKEAEKFIAPEFEIGRCEAWSQGDMDYASSILGRCGHPSTDGWPMALPDDALKRGVRALGGRRLKRVLHRLKSGHPIHVLALGGSVMEQGGCWGDGCSSTQGYEKEGENTAAWLSATGRRDEGKRLLGPREPGRPMRSLWLSRFMQWVNYTWPHADHAAFNHGIGGHGSYVVEQCPADYLYPGADLVIVEFAVNGGDYESLELLLVNVMRLPKRPAVLFVNAYWWCRDADGSEGHKARAAGECDDQLKSEDLERLRLASADKEPDITRLAVKYNLSSVSIYPALMPLVLEAGPQLVPLDTITDGMHPRHPWVMSWPEFAMIPYGVYLSDLMVELMRTAARRPELLATDVDLSVAPLCENFAQGYRDRCSSPIQTIKCFDWEVNARPLIRSNFEGAGEVPARYEGVMVQPDHESRVRIQEKPVGADWFFSRFPIDGNEEVLRRFRPGMVSVVPGAAADFVLPMAQVAPQYRKSVSALEVRYFVSYEHMGVVQLECVGGCACEPQRLDCYTPKAFSGGEVTMFNLTGFGGQDECVIRATNTKRTAGREGSKVKLMGFYVKAFIGSATTLIREAEAAMYHHKHPNDF